MNFKVIPVLFTLALVSISGVPFQSAYADDVVSQTLFYTTFAGGTNVNQVTISYNEFLATLTIGPSSNIASTPGADGLTGNPQDANSLLIGAQNGAQIHNINIMAGTFTSTNTANGLPVYHLEIPDANTVYGMGIPSVGISSHPIVGGVVGAGTLISPADGTSTVTQIITTPGSTFYTSSGGPGNGDFGTITIGATYTLTSITNPLPAAHGGVYDPFSNSVILFGSNHITQYSLAGVQLSDLVVGTPQTVQFDQGTVDGMGHLYVADNTGGNLFFLDYSTSALKEVGDVTNFQSLSFLANQLDDIGPLVGMGTTEEPIGGTILEINSASLLLAGLQSMTIWMAPVLAGAAGVAAFYLKSRKN